MQSRAIANTGFICSAYGLSLLFLRISAGQTVRVPELNVGRGGVCIAFFAGLPLLRLVCVCLGRMGLFVLPVHILMVHCGIVRRHLLFCLLYAGLPTVCGCLLLI